MIGFRIYFAKYFYGRDFEKDGMQAYADYVEQQTQKAIDKLKLQASVKIFEAGQTMTAIKLLKKSIAKFGRWQVINILMQINDEELATDKADLNDELNKQDLKLLRKELKK